MKKTFKNIAMMATILLALSACSSTKKISDINLSERCKYYGNEKKDLSATP